MKDEPNVYAVIPSKIMRDKRLKLGARLLYGEITSLSNQKGFCWATNEYFAELYDCKKNTISLWVNELKMCEYISVEMLYHAGTKNIDKRIIKLLPYHEKKGDPITKNDDTLSSKNVIPYHEKKGDPITKNGEDNTIIEYSNIITNTGVCVKDFEISNTESFYQGEISELNQFFKGTAKNSEILPAKIENHTKVAIKEKDVVKAKKTTVFQAPTLEEVYSFMEIYFLSKNKPKNKVEETANEFFNNYESVGWKVGRNPMVSWEASARKWVGNMEKYNYSSAKNANTPQTQAKKVFNGVLTE